MKPIRKQTPVSPKRAFLGALNEQERLFLLLVAVLGYGVGFAYKTAFGSNANLVSATAMGSKLMASSHIQTAYWRLAQLHQFNLLEFNGKMLRNI